MSNQRRVISTREVTTMPRFALALITAIATALTLASLSSADLAPSASTDHHADAVFTSTVGCLFTEVGIQADDVTSRNPPTTAVIYSQASVGILVVDNCLNFNPVLAGGVVDLSPADFTLSQALDSARLQKTFLLPDFASGQLIQVTVDVSWTGTGDITRDSNNYHTIFPPNISVGHTATRSAQATGTVVVGSTNFTPLPSVNGNLTIAEGIGVFPSS
jgi:hypothetical protein